MMRKVTQDTAGGVMVGQERVVKLDIADDVALLADSCLVMLAMIMKMEEVTQSFRIYISARRASCYISAETKAMLQWKILVTEVR